MTELTLNRLPTGAKVVAGFFMVTIGVGYLFALGQLKNVHGEVSYSQIVRDYYGRPALRDSLDAHWAALRDEAVTKWEAGERGSQQSTNAVVGTLNLDDLDMFDRPAVASPVDRLLRRATSTEHLQEVIDQEHESDLMVKLGIPSVAHVVQLGHTHTFGHAAFFLPVCILMLLTSLPWNIKGIIASAPLLGIILDYPSALMTRLFAPEFAMSLMLGGTLMGLGFLACFTLVMFDLWVKPYLDKRRDR
jgi:hypothetical protein